MTYLQFLLVFLVPPIALLGCFFAKSSHRDRTIFFRGILVLCTLAFVWTTPWDNYLVARGIWSYGADRVLGAVGYVPIEEYMFFFLQTIMTGLWCFWLHSRLPIVAQALEKRRGRGVLATLAGCWGFGVWALFSTSTLYMGLILAWALPVCLLQWALGGPFLLKNWRFYALGVLPPTLYLWVADALAIHWEVWTIAKATTVGLFLGNLPVEEALFFLLTNMMVVQGIVLFVAMKDWVTERLGGRALYLYRKVERPVP